MMLIISPTPPLVVPTATTTAKSVIDLAFTVRPLPFDSLCDDEVRSHP